METGLSTFLNMLFMSFKWEVDGSAPLWLQLIVTLIAVYYAVRRDHSRSAHLVKIMFIVSFWGTLYGIFLTLAAVSNPALPAEQKGVMLTGGLSASLISVICAVSGWLVVSVLEVFLGQPKTTA